jgi:hypothetical protein
MLYSVYEAQNPEVRKEIVSTMNNIDRKRLLVKASIKKDFGDLFMYLPFTGGVTIAVMYACVFRNAYRLLKDPLITVIVAGSVTLSIAVVFLWYRTPKIHLLGSVLPKWQTAITRSLRKIGYDLVDSNSHVISFYKGRKHWFSVMHTKCVIFEDRDRLYACVWKGSVNITRDILYSGKSEARSIQRILYANDESHAEPQIADLRRQTPPDSNNKLKMEFLHADNSVDDFSISEQEAVKRVLSLPWDSELSQAVLLRQVSPTVSLEYPERKHVLWASVIQKVGDDFEFLVCLQRKDKISVKKKLSGPQEKDIQIAESDEISISELPELFHLFYAGEFETLANKIKKR